MTVIEEASPLLARFVDNLDLETAALIDEWREQGWGYKRVYEELKKRNVPVSRAQVQEYCAQLDRTVMSAIGDAEDNGIPVPVDYFTARGIELPPEGMQFVAATITEVGPGGEKNWVRIKPDATTADGSRVELRQAQPIDMTPAAPAKAGLTLLSPGEWQTWVASPDAQIGYWLDSEGNWHTIHDERCFSLGHQIAATISEYEGLYGWLDVGDLADLAAPSRHNPTVIDLQVEGLNKTWDRVSQEFATRRFYVGTNGELVVLSGNHDIRLSKAAAAQMPYLVGMKRAGDPDDEFPVLSVPYLTRARDYGVEWVPSFPSGYRRLNSNLAAFHAPAYGSKALDTARKIAAKVHSSVIHGHTHRREALAENIETVDKGARTLEIWSDGTWARVDGSLPGQSSTYDEAGDRLISGTQQAKWGVLSPNMHQGLSVIHVEVSGRERFSAERVAFWDGWAQFRGDIYESKVDAEGVAV